MADWEFVKQEKNLLNDYKLGEFDGRGTSVNISGRTKDSLEEAIADFVPSIDEQDKSEVSLDEDDTMLDSKREVSLGEEETEQEEIGNEESDDLSVILDQTTYGAIKRSDSLFYWSIDGLLNKKGKVYNAFHLDANPPVLSFKRPGEEPFKVILGKAEVEQLAPALERVRRAYNSIPIEDKKKEPWSKRNFRRKLREAFEDNPLGFIGKIIGGLLVVAIIIALIVIQ